MAKGNMTVGKSNTAGSFGFKKLGEKTTSMAFNGLSTNYSYQPDVNELRNLVQEYLDTGKFDIYSGKNAKEFTKKIAADLQERGAAAFEEDGKYIRTIDDMKVLVSKSKKDDKWHAKVSNAEYGPTFNTVVGRYSKKK